jgi:hypothetical protein
MAFPTPAEMGAQFKVVVPAPFAMNAGDGVQLD